MKKPAPSSPEYQKKQHRLITLSYVAVLSLLALSIYLVVIIIKQSSYQKVAGPVRGLFVTVICKTDFLEQGTQWLNPKDPAANQVYQSMQNLLFTWARELNVSTLSVEKVARQRDRDRIDFSRAVIENLPLACSEKNINPVETGRLIYEFLRATAGNSQPPPQS